MFLSCLNKGCDDDDDDDDDVVPDVLITSQVTRHKLPFTASGFYISGYN